MVRKSSIKQKIAQMDLLLGKSRHDEAFGILAKIKPSEFSGSSPQTGHLLYFVARSLYRKANYREALLKAQKAFDILRHTSQRKRIGEIKILLGNNYYSTGDLKQAEIEYCNALNVFKKIKHNRGIVDGYNAIAHIFFIQSNFEEAVKCLKSGIKIARKSEDLDRVSMLSHNLSTVYVRLGKWYLGEEMLLMVLGIVRKIGSKTRLASVFLTLGHLVFHQRRFAEAENYYKEGYRLVTEAGDLYQSAIFYQLQGGLSFVQGDFIKTRELYNKALEIGEKVASQGDITGQACCLLAELELSEGNLDEAIRESNRSLEVSLKLKDRLEEGVVYKILAQVYYNKKDSQKTKDYFKRSINTLKEIKAIYELGRTYLEAGRSNCYSYFERLKFLGSAQDLFSEVDTKYYIALTCLAISELLYNNNEFNKSLSFALKAEDIFGRLNEKKELEKTTKFRVKLEREATQAEDLKDIPSKFSFSSFITQNKEMLDIVNKAGQIKDKDMTILLQGETGTGKDFLVRMIHHNSNRANSKFIALNCANLPEALLESELFGHKKGAFTGANQDKKGLLEVASGGTLFLNEVGELPLPIQAKLLSVLEEKEFTRLGDTDPIKVDVRIIAATNKDLEKVIENGRFREDLYYRLSVIKLNLPPLRERKDDIKLLLEHFLEKHGQENKHKLQKANHELAEVFMNYPWPGNVRELENEIIKLSTLVEVSDEDGLSRLVEQVRKEKKLEPSSSSKSLQKLPSQDNLNAKVEEYEKNLILSALEENNWVIVKTAKVLKIPESTLHFKIKKFKLSCK